MSTQLDPAQLAIEFLRRDKTDLSPAQYLKRLKQLELEFADLLALSSTELKEEIYFAWRKAFIDSGMLIVTKPRHAFGVIFCLKSSLPLHLATVNLRT